MNYIGDNFIYCHIPKTGGQSILNCLYSEKKLLENSVHGFSGRFCDAHILYCGLYPQEHDEFYFTFVRNPFSRLISAWLWCTEYVFMKDKSKVVYAPKIEMNFEDWFQLKFYTEEFWERNLDLKISFSENYVKTLPQKLIDINMENIVSSTLNWYQNFGKDPQINYLKPEKESMEIYLDFIGHQENMKSDWEIVKNNIGIKSDLPFKHKTRNVDYQKFYTHEMKQKVFAHYKEDFEKFDYDF